MNKLILKTVSLMLGLTLTIQASAQQKAVNSTFKPGWTVGANGGMNMFMGEGNNFLNKNKAHVFSLGENGSYLGRLSAGYNFTPVIGLKGMIGYYNFKWSTVPQNTDGTYPYYRFGSENLTADLMVNLSNWIAGYNPERKLDFSLFLGTGLAYVNQNGVASEQPTTDLSPLALLGRGGLQLDYHLTDVVNLNLIVENSASTDNFNENNNQPLSVDIFPAITVGVSYRLPAKEKKRSQKAQIEQKADLLDQSLVVEAKKDTVVKEKIVQPDLTQELVKADVAEVAKEVVSPVSTEGYVSGLNEKLFYTINSATVSQMKHGAALAKIAEYVKQHPTAIITVSGYADKSTGSIDANNMMSKHRAVILANTLIRYYGVNYKNIQVKWYGGGVQPYRTAEKNRLAVVKSPAMKNGISLVKEKVAEEVSTPAKTETKAEGTTTEGLYDLFTTINFTNNSANIVDAKQEADIMKVALYMRKFPQTKILVSGYADKSSGSADKNNELSKSRAVNVTNTLIQKYSINANRIQTKWFGGEKQSYTTPSMNRLVLIETIK